MKKSLLAIGSIVTAVAPVATIVSCTNSGAGQALPTSTTTGGSTVQTPAGSVANTLVHRTMHSSTKTPTITLAGGKDFHKLFHTSGRSNPPVGTVFAMDFSGHHFVIDWTQENFDAIAALKNDTTWQQEVVNYVFNLTNNPEDRRAITSNRHHTFKWPAPVQSQTGPLGFLESVAAIGVTSEQSFTDKFMLSGLMIQPHAGVSMHIHIHNGAGDSWIVWSQRNVDFVNKLKRDGDWLKNVEQYVMGLTNHPEDVQLLPAYAKQFSKLIAVFDISKGLGDNTKSGLYKLMDPSHPNKPEAIPVGTLIQFKGSPLTRDTVNITINEEDRTEFVAIAKDAIAAAGGNKAAYGKSAMPLLFRALAKVAAPQLGDILPGGVTQLLEIFEKWVPGTNATPFVPLALSFGYDGQTFTTFHDLGHFLVKPGTSGVGIAAGKTLTFQTYSYTFTADDVTRLTHMVSRAGGQTDFVKEIAKLLQLPTDVAKHFVLTWTLGEAKLDSRHK